VVKKIVQIQYHSILSFGGGHMGGDVVWFETDLPVPHVGAARLEERFAKRALRGLFPEYPGKAIDTLLYKVTYDVLKDKQVSMGINYALEDI